MSESFIDRVLWDVNLAAQQARLNEASQQQPAHDEAAPNRPYDWAVEDESTGIQ